MPDLQRLNSLLGEICNLSDRAGADWARDQLAEYLGGLEDDIRSLREEVATVRATAFGAANVASCLANGIIPD